MEHTGKRAFQTCCIRWYLITTIPIAYGLSRIGGLIGFGMTKDPRYLLFIAPEALIPINASSLQYGNQGRSTAVQACASFLLFQRGLLIRLFVGNQYRGQEFPFSDALSSLNISDQFGSAVKPVDAASPGGAILLRR